MMNYKGYLGKVDYDDEAQTFYGTVINANVLISFRGSSVGKLKKSFHDVVDTYLDDCKKEKKSPEKPYSGKITLRIPPEVHRRIAIKAAECKESMNEYLEKLLEQETADVASK